MEDNEFMLKLVALLDKAKSKKQVNSDIRELEKVVKNLRLTATLLKGESKKNLNQTVKLLEGQLNKIKLQAKIDQKNLKSDIDKALQNISFKDLKDIDINIDSSKTKLKVQKALADVKKAAQNTPISVNVDLKKEKLKNDLTSYLSRNSRVRESESLLKEADKLREKIVGINDKDSLRNVTQEFQLFKSECSATGYQAKSTTEKIRGLIGNATKIGSAFGLASMAVSNFQKSLKTIKMNDSILTEISKTSDLTEKELKQLGLESFDTASKYGRTASDYLSGVQSMSQSGFYGKAGEAMAEQSLLAQSAGDMTQEVADKYVIATNAAYKFNGEANKINAVLDGQNSISNRNSVALQDMATAMSEAGTVASSYNVNIEDLSAMIGTMEAVTKSGGSEVGNSIKSILINLQNVTSDKITDTLTKANASMTEFVDGTEKLRNPISIIRDLAKTFNQLDEDDPLRAEILTNVGGKYQATKLAALLQNMDMFDKMLVDYSNGAGSALREADLSANDLTGTLNKLSNSWDALVNSITSKSTIKGGVSFLDALLQSATKLIDTVDVLPVALASFTAFTTAKNKDVGIRQIFNEDGKFDVQGNFMGIDISSIKHFSQAKKAISEWNNELKAGKIDINKFNSEVVKNNASLRNYLSTCNDGSASLKGYKQSLQAAGEATTSLRLGTILLNSALSFGLAVAIEGVISGLDYLIHKEEKEAEALEEAKNKFTQTTDEIKSLNDELSSTQDKIAELQKLADSGTISVADENELKLLKETNKELQRKIALKQKEQIDDAKRVLENVRKNNKEKQYSISYYKPDGTTATKRKKGDASEYLQDMIAQYENVTKYSERDDTFKENANKNISKQAEKVADLVDAYERLKDAGVALTKGQQAEYESALKAQDAYLLYSYNLNKTKEGFRALNEEQKRSILNDRLLGQGLTGQEVKVVLKYIPEEDLDDYYGFDFDFPLPDRKDYKTAEEYGKAYAEAWKNGVESTVQDENGIVVDKTAQQLEALKETYESVSDNVSTLTTALSESVSGTGLSSDSVAGVTSIFSDLKGYDEDKLLDKTANGLRLNTRELEKLKKEYDDNTAKEFYNNVEDAYNAWQDALRNGEEQSVVDSLYDQYQQAAQLADQYVGLTSAYNKWQEALSTANEGDMYDSIYNNIKSVKELYKKGLVGTDDFRTYVDLISPKDLAGATTEEVVRAYQQSIGKIERYFTDGHKGAENFLKDVQKINSEWAHMNKDGSWEIDFGAGGSSDKDVAKKLGIDVEALQAILRKLVDYGFDIDFGDSFGSLEMMGVAAEKAYSKLKELGKIGKKMKFKFDTGDIAEVNKQIEDAKNVLNKFRDKNGNVDVNVKGAKEAQIILSKLLSEKQEIEKPAILKVDTSQLSGKAVGVVSMLQRIQQEINTYDIQMKIGADTTETKKKIKEDIKAIKANYGEELSDININLDSISSAKQELKNLGENDIELAVNAIVNHKKVDDYKKEKEKKTIEVETELNDTAVNEFMDKTLEKTIKAKVEVDSSELDKASSKPSKKDSKNKEKEEKSDNKKSHADGTFNLLKGNLAKQGFANASGNISIPKDQTALVNEMGEELIVRDGRWFTVKGGAQFTELKKGDIVFNHLQTRQLLRNGKITSSDNRGRMAYHDGTGTTGSGIPGWTYSSTDNKSKKKSSKSKKSSDKDKKKDSKQLIDWIERKLDVLQDKIDFTKAKFENLFSVRKKKNNLNTQIKQTTKLLNNEQKAIAKYQKKADSIKLSDSLKKKVRNGAIKGSLSELIREYGEKTANQISKYQDYIDKVKDAKKAVAELKTEIKDLSRQKLDLKLDDNDRKRTYQEARYANATTAKQKHKILNKEINTYKSDDKAYAEYYKESKKQRKKDGKKAETAVSNTKGLGKSAKNKIKKLIKQGKEIPSALMKKVKKHSIPAYNKLLDYNRSVDFVSDALRDKKLANEQNETNIREKRIERAQNYADEAEAEYNLNQQYEANAASAKDKNKYEAKSLKYLDKQYAKLIKVAELEGDATEQKRLQAELEAKRKESYQTQYDNIKTEYDNKTGLNDSLISKAQAQIATLEAAGVTVSKEMYRTMMQISDGTKKRLLEEREELLEAGKDFKYGSAEWCAWQDDLLTIDQQLESCTQNTIEWQKKMNELDFKKFSLFAQQLDATGNHLNFLVDMLSHQDLTSKESGGLTDAGFATISLRFSSIENYRQSIKNAQEELAKLYEKHADGSDFLSEEEFLAKREEQLDIIRQGTEAIEDEKEAILDLVNDAMELQIDSINELIEKKKKALATEKDLYSYQQRVAKQTKNIALIEKQIAALSGDRSEEARARTQKLQASLEEAQQDLKDTEYDKWHEDQNEMLDSLADEVEEFWEKLMNDLKKNIDGSLDNILKMVTDNPDAVARALDELGLGDALSIITTYNPDGTHGDKAIDYGGNSYESTYNKDGDNINSPMKGQADAAAENLSNAAKNLEETERLANAAEQLKDKLTGHLGQDGKKPDKEPERQPSNENYSVKNNATEGKDAIAAFLKSSALHKPTTEAGKKRMKTDPLLKYIAKNYNGKTLSNVNEAKLGSYLGITVKDKNNVSDSEAQKILKAFKGAGFADGGIAATLNRAAKENGDDGIITIQKGEAVLNKEQTENIREIAERGFVPAMPLTGEQVKFLTEYMNTPYDLSMQMYGNIPPATTTNTSVSVGDINVHLDGSGVVDMESMFQQLNQPRNRQRMSECVLRDIKSPFPNILKSF